MIRYFNPINWLRWTGQFLYAWIASISWQNASAGIPAFLLTIALAVMTFVAYTDGKSWRKQLIKDQLETAKKAEDFSTAELLIRRLISEGDDSHGMLFQLALSVDQQNNADEATEMMRDLALRGRNDQAALWLVQEVYMGKKWQDLSEDKQQEFGKLLALLSEERPDEMQIKQLYADYLIATNRYSDAIPYLRDLSKVQPMRGLQAAAISRRMGDTVLADRLAEATLERVDELFKEEPANPILALAVVQNQIFLERHADAVRTLNESIGRMKTPEHQQQLQQAMGDTIVDWIAKIESAPNESEVEQLRVLKMLQIALQYAPNNPRVLSLVANQVLATLEAQDEGIIAIRNALVHGTSPGIAHFVRGTAYLLKNDSERATRHLKLAAEHLPNSAGILNNLAVAMAAKTDGNLEQALQISQQAISQTADPGPYFYETRGQILFRMQRYLDAIPDMERALGAPELSVAAHKVLALCYDNLGEPELAADHREASLQIEKQLKVQQPTNAKDLSEREKIEGTDDPEAKGENNLPAASDTETASGEAEPVTGAVRETAIDMK